MNGYISIIKYYPDNNRDEGFGIGIILISEGIPMPLVRISKERLKRINSAFGIKKSVLIESTIEEISSKSYDKSKLDYLSVYENGNLRYTKPQIINSDNLTGKFEDLYFKLIADYYEENAANLTINKRDISNRWGYCLRKKLESNSLIKEKLNIGYDFKGNSIGKFLFGNSIIDFIGGNGHVYAGEIINLDLQEESLQRSLYKTIALFEAIEKAYPKKFDAKDCKLLVLKDQALNPEKADYMDILNTWHKRAEYDLVIQKDLNDFQQKIEEDVKEKNIIQFEKWVMK